jgi:hypothetical protein
MSQDLVVLLSEYRREMMTHFYHYDFTTPFLTTLLIYNTNTRSTLDSTSVFLFQRYHCVFPSSAARW